MTPADELERCYRELERLSVAIEGSPAESVSARLLADYERCFDRITDLEAQIGSELRSWRPTDAPI
jgi:hypothetical protein